MKKINIKRSIALIAAIAIFTSPGVGPIESAQNFIQSTVSAAQANTPLLDKYNVTANVGDTVTVRVLNPTMDSYKYYVSSYYATDKNNYTVNYSDVQSGKYDASLMNGATDSFVDVITFRVVNAGKFELEVTYDNGSTAVCNIVAVQPVTAITLNKTEACITAGDTFDLTATTSPADATDATITWSSSDNSVATVNNGSVTTLKAGTATITASCGDVTATCEVFVGSKEPEPAAKPSDETPKETVVPSTTTAAIPTPTAANSVPARPANSTAPILDKYNINANVGDTVTVRVLNPSDEASSWYVSSYYAFDKKYCLVNSSDVKNGKYDASLMDGAIYTYVDVYSFKVKNPGKFEFEVSYGGGEVAVCNIVAVQPATKVSLSKSEAQMTVGETVNVFATVEPSNTTDPTIIWKSSNPSVASVKNGEIKALKEGETTITATCGTVSSTCNVFVGAAPEPEKPETKPEVKEPETPAKEIIPCKSICWERMGDNTIIVSGPAAKVGQTKDFSELIVEVYPKNTTDTITFSSSNTKVATVDKNTGVVTYTGTGTTDIIATATSGVSAKIRLVICSSETHCEEVRFTSNRFSNSDARVGGTANYKLRIETRPYIGNVVDTFKFSSSDPSIVSITEDGMATYHKTGKATLYVESSNGKKASTTVVIYPASGSDRPCVDLEFYTDLYVYSLSEKTAKSALILDVLPKNTTSKITYSIADTSIATIDANTGVITFKKAGTTKITAKSNNGLTATTTIKIIDNINTVAESDTSTTTEKPTTATKVTNLYLSPSSATINIDETKQISPKIFPTTLSSEKVTWTSSDTSVAVVTNGLVKAVGKGTADITAVCGGKTAVCKVTVDVPLKMLRLKDLGSQTIGGTYKMVYTYYPINATIPSVTWTSADPTIASIDSNGKVTFNKEGTTNITVACGAVTATCSVTVVPVLAKNIDLPDGTYEINACTYTAIDWSKYITPSNADMSSKANAITWTTTDKNVVRYEPSRGMLYSSKEGTATLTATLPNGTKDTWTIKAVAKSDGNVKFLRKEYSDTIKVTGTGADWTSIYAEIDGAGAITVNKGESIKGKDYFQCYKEMWDIHDSVSVISTRVEFYKPGDYTLYVWPTNNVKSSNGVPTYSSQVATAPTDTCVVHIKGVNSTGWCGEDSNLVTYAKSHPTEIAVARQKLLNELNAFRKARGVAGNVKLDSSSANQLAQTRVYEASRLWSHYYTYDDNGNVVKATPVPGGECLGAGSIENFGKSPAHTSALLSPNLEYVSFGVLVDPYDPTVIRSIVVLT